MRFSIRTLIWTTVLLAMILAGSFAFVPKPVNVEVAPVVEGLLRVTVQEDGKTRIREKYVVSAPVSGRLSRIELREGDEIRADDTLVAVIQPSDPAMLDARTRAQAEARVRGAEAAIRRSESTSNQAQINHDLAKTKFDRAQRLLESNAISQDEFDIAKAEFLAAVQGIKTARFESEISQFELEMARAAVRQFTNEQVDSAAEPFEIYSPISGKVLRVLQESAAVVSVGTPLLELGDPANLEIEVDVLSTDAVKIRPGASLTVEHWGGQSPLQANVRVIEPAAFTKISSLGVEEQRVNVIADFDEPPNRISSLGDGYRVEARITIREIPQALTIPNSSLFRHRRRWHIMKVEEGTAVLHPVEIGAQNETRTEVLKGLSGNEQLIVYPSDEIANGTRVRVVHGQNTR